MPGHLGVTGVRGPGGLLWVAVTAAVYLTAGIAVFRAGEKITKTRGTCQPGRRPAYRPGRGPSPVGMRWNGPSGRLPWPAR